MLHQQNQDLFLVIAMLILAAIVVMPSYFQRTPLMRKIGLGAGYGLAIFAEFIAFAIKGRSPMNQTLDLVTAIFFLALMLIGILKKHDDKKQ